MSIVSRLFGHSPLGMNHRNYIIREGSSFAALRRVKSKTGFKQLMEQNGIAVARTYQEVHDFSDVALVGTFSDEFVIKPNRGFGGKGVVLLKREDGHFLDPAGNPYTLSDIKRHIRKILDGDFSGYINGDIALVEERLYPSAKLQFKDACGMPDIRIFCFSFEPAMGMLRYATFKSRGRANLAAGGIGIGLEMRTGTPTFIHTKGGGEFKAEDIGIPDDFAMPKWDEMKAVAQKCSELAGLGVAGVDLVLDASEQIRVLEVNGRPGLEIQNINEESLLWRFRAPSAPDPRGQVSTTMGQVSEPAREERSG